MIDEAICPNIQYSNSVFSRKHSPNGYESYKSFKPWIRDEFWFRCLYCLAREAWSISGHRSFSIDHVVAQKSDPTQINSYDNLVYSCLWCNSAKRNVDIEDPVNEPFGRHLKILETGHVECKTDVGFVINELLFLNEPERVKCRRKGLVIAELLRREPDANEIRELYLDWFGFPEDIPDLEVLRPPSGNAKLGSEFLSVYARKQRDELGEVY